MIFDGNDFAKKILDEEVRLYAFGKHLKIAVIWVGDSSESEIYVKHKIEVSKSCEIETKLLHFPENVNPDEVYDVQKTLNIDPTVTGYFIQLPVPKSFDKKKMFSLIAPNKDIDGLNPVNLGKIWQYDDSGFVPATALGVYKVLREAARIDLESKNVVIINDSNIVGKPLAGLCARDQATVTICNKFTPNLASHTVTADIIISATGCVSLINDTMVKDGVILIDVGTKKCNVEEEGRTISRVKGDLDFESCCKKASFVTPVPGGVGPVTIACLLSNLCKAHKLTVQKP